MSDPKLAEIQELFDASLQVATGERADFVARSRNAPDVQAEVLTLLEHAAQVDDFLTKPAFQTFSAIVDQACNEVSEFHILRELGRGSMGVVYLAQDTLLRRQVALKVLNPHLTGSRTAIERFRREAQAVARLSHSALVPVYRYGENRGTHFIAMKFIDGETLHQSLSTLRSGLNASAGSNAPTTGQGARKSRSCPNPKISGVDYIRSCAQIARSLANGLEYAHCGGVLHRDVKPSNILIDTGGQPKLADFGVARIDAMDGLTLTGDIAGTFKYMSPEQVSRGVLDRRTDVFSLGVVLYEMLVLESPFHGENTPEIFKAIQEKEPTLVRSLNRSVPRDLEVICHKALEKIPRDRYPTSAHLAADLDCFLRGDPIMARPPTTARKVGRWFNKRKSHSLVGLIILFCCSLGVAGGVHLQNQWQSMASVSVRLKVPDPSASALVRRWDHPSQKFGATQSVGPLPINDYRLEPDLYRFVVTNDAGRFVESDEVLLAGDRLEKTISISEVGPPPSDMVLFPAGAYAVSPVRKGGGAPDQVLFMEGFFLDRCQVTNAQYLEFVQANDYHLPIHWGLYGYDEALGDHPIVGISLTDAQAYALWRGVRLPTAAEWEAAARFPDGRLFPWGPLDDAPSQAFPTYEALVAVHDEEVAVQYVHYTSRTRSVTDDPNGNTNGVLLHLLGNVFELTSTVMPHDPNQVVIKGGSWASHPRQASLRSFITYPRNESTLTLGFRCARSQSAVP